MSDGAMPRIGELWQDAFNKGNGDALAALYAQDAIAMPPGADLVEGFEKVAALMTAHLGHGLQTEITPLETKVHGPLGWQVGRWRLCGPDGDEIDHGKFFQLWRQDEDGWRIARDIWNSSKGAE